MKMSISGVSSAKELPGEKKKKQHKSWHQAESTQMAGKTTNKKNSFILNSDTNIYTEMLSHRRMESTEPVKAKLATLLDSTLKISFNIHLIIFPWLSQENRTLPYYYHFTLL